MGFFESDLDVFFGGEFKDEIEFLGGSLQGKAFPGFFETRFLDHNVGTMRVSTQAAYFLGKKAQLGQAADGDLVKINGRNYQIIAKNDDQTGVVELELGEKIESDDE